MEEASSTLGLQNRWAYVLEVGSDCTEVQKGDRVCIYAQKWTEGMDFGDKDWIWFSDEEHVMLVDLLHRKTDGVEKFPTDNFLRKGLVQD